MTLPAKTRSCLVPMEETEETEDVVEKGVMVCVESQGGMQLSSAPAVEAEMALQEEMEGLGRLEVELSHMHVKLCFTLWLGDGGRGGNITVTVAADDMHLLALLDCSARGGKGGRAGVHGSGGEGGEGGRGGAMFAWQEARTRQATDYQGHYWTETYYVPMFSPAGSDGSRGPRGHTPNSTLNAGQTGAHGVFTVRIINSNGTEQVCNLQTVWSIYHPVVTGFTITPDSGAEIFEPGDYITLSNITIQNQGKIHTPLNTQVYIAKRIDDSVAILDELRMQTSSSLRPQESVTLPGTYKCKIKDYLCTEELKGGYTATHNICLVPMLHKVFVQFQDLTKSVSVSLPIVQEPINFIDSLSSKDIGECQFEIKNTLKRPIGSGSEGQRRVMLHIGLQMEPAMAKSVMLFDSNNNKCVPPQCLVEIDKIDGRSSVKVPIKIGVLSDSGINYKHIKINTSLIMDSPASPLARPIQKRSKQVQISEPHAGPRDANVLLVTNSHVTDETVTKWRGYFEELDMSVATLNFTINGDLAVEVRICAHLHKHKERTHIRR